MLSPVQEVAAIIEREKLISLLDGLFPREAEAIKLRFGLMDSVIRILGRQGKGWG